MYLLWHSGDTANRITVSFLRTLHAFVRDVAKAKTFLQPMIKFTLSDLSFLPKRARQSFHEVKSLVRLVDDKAKSRGVNVKAVMTPAESSSAFQEGSSSLAISSTTPSGRQRNIAKLKWATLLKYANESKEESKKKKIQEESKKGEEESKKSPELASTVATLNGEVACDISDDPEKQDE